MIISQDCGDATKALMSLMCCFQVFDLHYPVPLKHFFIFMENVMRMTKGYKITRALDIFNYEVLHEQAPAEYATSSDYHEAKDDEMLFVQKKCLMLLLTRLEV